MASVINEIIIIMSIVINMWHEIIIMCNNNVIIMYEKYVAMAIINENVCQ
jgi:hypothetical protein